MNNVLTLTIAHTPWCTEHEAESDECTSTPIQAGSASCWVWLVQHRRESVEPTIVVDVPPNGAVLTLEQASDLTDAIRQLRQAVTTAGRPVPS